MGATAINHDGSEDTDNANAGSARCVYSGVWNHYRPATGKEKPKTAAFMQAGNVALTFCQCGGIKGSCDCKPVKQTTKQRGYGHDWRKLSERIRKEKPLCEDCLEKGKTKPATEVHHIKPISQAPHLRLAYSNLKALCSDCHDARHK